MQARTNELERRPAEQEKPTKNIRFEQEQEQIFIMQTAALARKAEKETIDKTYEFQGYPVNGDTTSLQDFTYWILPKANFQKHCVANMTRTDNYKTEKTNMTVTFRDLGTKKMINAWFLRNRSIMYTSSLGHYFQSHYIRGKWSVLSTRNKRHARQHSEMYEVAPRNRNHA